MTDRNTQRRAFLDRTDWRAATVGNLAGDASNRRYFRLTDLINGETAVLMDAPPEKGEDIKPFIAIARHLSGIGLAAPAILAADETSGFLLLEDLGDALFARVLEANKDQEVSLYDAACDVLLHLHTAKTPADLPEYDPLTMTDLAELAFTWYLPGVTGRADDASHQKFSDVMYQQLNQIENVTDVLIQRDYHAENLLWLPERNGLLRVGLLDFQDAAKGHRAYDLVSLLQDARRDVPDELQRQIVDTYIRKSNVQADAFRWAYHLLGLQRNLRILGVFVRLCVRDGKPHYVDYIPRVWGYLMQDLKYLNTPELETVFAALPHPGPDALLGLKDKCKTQAPS